VTGFLTNDTGLTDCSILFPSLTLESSSFFDSTFYWATGSLIVLALVLAIRVGGL